MLAMTAAAAMLGASGAKAQTKAARLEFEVASVKTAPDIDFATALSSGKMPHMKIDAAMVDIAGLSLKQLILNAYGIKAYQLSGPDWMDSAKFDIAAKMPQGATKEQVPEMLQALLADRLKLTVHRESKDQAVYALVLGKDGPKLKPSLPDADPPADAATGEDGGRGGSIKTTRKGDGISGTMTGPNGKTNTSVANGILHLDMAKMTLTALAESLTTFLDRPALDMTGLKGDYQIALDFSVADTLSAAKVLGMREDPAAAGGDTMGTASDPSGSSVFATVQRLGLRLERRRAPVEVLVVDHLEKTPTEN